MNHGVTIRSSTVTSADTLRTTESGDWDRYLHTHRHSSVLHNSRKVEATQVPSAGERVNNVWHLHTMRYYSAVKRTDILTQATT